MLTKKDYKYLEMAVSLAKLSEHYKSKVGAILIRNKTIIGYGINHSDKSHPLQKYYNDKFRGFKEDTCRHLLHAELAAILDAEIKSETEDNVELKLYVARVHKNDTITASRPCKSCLAAIKDYRIANLYYTTLDGYSYEYIKQINNG